MTEQVEEAVAEHGELSEEQVKSIAGRGQNPLHKCRIRACNHTRKDNFDYTVKASTAAEPADSPLRGQYIILQNLKKYGNP